VVEERIPAERVGSTIVPRRRDPSPDDIATWDAIRRQAATATTSLIAGAPTDPLRFIAWWSGLDQTLPARLTAEKPLAAAIDKALGHRATWREITAALGLPDDDDTVARVTARQARRRTAVAGDSDDSASSTP
jgi:hypothetical protein